MPQLFTRPMFVLAVLVLVCINVNHAADNGLVGVYQLEGRNQDGTTYAGVVTITANGSAWDIWWKDETSEMVGVGLLTGKALSVVFRAITSPEPVGLASYEVGRKGWRRRLVGRWIMPPYALIGAETLTEMDPRYFAPPPDLPRMR